MATRRLVVEVIGEDKSFKKAVQNTAASTDKLEKKFSNLDNTVGDFNRSMTAAGNVVKLVKFPALIAGAGMAAQAVGALGAGAVGLGAALAPLAGLGAAGAAGLTAFGQAAGVAGLALAGVGGALKEQLGLHSKAGAAAAKAGSSQVSSARAVRDAEEGVRTARLGVGEATRSLTDALRGQTKATKDVAVAENEARRNLADMRAGAVDAILGVRQATLSLTDARRTLTSLLSGPDIRAVADAHEAVADSVRDEQHAVLALTDAREALDRLVRGASVLDLADAHDAVADAARDETRANLALTDAKKAANAVLDSPASTEEDKAKARLSVADAENAVEDAKRSSQRAAEKLQELEAPPSQQDVAKARLAVADAENAVGDAKNGSKDAQDALTKAEAGPSAEDIAKARLAVAEAEQTLTVARRDNRRQQADLAKAEHAGVQGAPGVVAAREAVAQAERDVADARRGVSDASRGVVQALQRVRDVEQDAAASSKQASGGAADLSKELNALPPAAQEFVRLLVSMKPKLDELRATAASGLLPGVGAGLTAAAKNFGHVKDVVGVTATAMGGLAKKAGELIGSKGFGKDLETIGRRNATIITHIGNGAISLGDAFRHVVAAAGPLTSWLARLAEQGGAFIDTQAKAGRESGKMAAFFDRTRSVLTILGHVIRDFGVGLFNVFSGGVPLGNDLLGLLEKLAAKFRSWTESISGKNQIAAYFRNAKGPFLETIGLIGDVAGALLKISTGKGATPLIKQLRTLVPIFEDVVTNTTAAFGPALIDALGNMLRLFGQLAGSNGPLVMMVRFVGAIAGALAGALGHNSALRSMTASFIGLYGVTKALLFVFGPLGKAFKVLEVLLFGQATATNLATGATIRYRVSLVAATIAAKAQAVATKIAAAAQWLWNAALTANPIALVVVGIAALAAGIIYAYQHSETFRNIVNDLWGAIKTITGAVWDFLTSLKDLPGKLWDAGKAITEGVINGIKALPGLLAAAATWLWQKLKDGIESYLDAYKAAGSWLLNRIVDGFKVVTGLLKSVGGWVKDRISDFIKLEIAGFKNVGGWVLNRIVDGFKLVTDLLKTVGGWVKNRIVEFIKLEIDGFTTVGSWIVNRVVDGFKTVTKALGGAGSWLLSTIKGLFKEVKDDFVGLGGDVVGWIVDGLRGGLKLLGKFAIDVLKVIDLIPGVSTKGAQKSVAKFAGLDSPDKKARGGVLSLAKGGTMVPGSGHGDKVPLHINGRLSAMVEPGELVSVANRNATAALMRVNRAVPRYAAGGVFDSTSYGPPWTGINGTGTTATGVNLKGSPHTFGVAVDPSVIALGSALDIWPNPFNTRSKFKAFDTGSAIKGRRLDFYDWRGRAAQYGWGSRQVRVGGGAVGPGIGDILGNVADALNPLDLIKKLPGVGDLPGWLKGTGKYVIGKVGDYIKDKVSSILPGGGGGETSTKGLVPQVKRALAFARGHGWHGGVNSGFRTYQEQAALYARYLAGGNIAARPGTSSHEKGQAVDVSDIPGFARAMGIAPANSRLLSLVPGDPVHFSVTGHARGGVIAPTALPYVGKYHQGGTSPAEGLAHVAKGERIGGPAVHIENVIVDSKVGVNSLAERIAFRVATA